MSNGSPVPCAHGKTCGGCPMLDMPYLQQIDFKKRKLEKLLAKYYVKEIEIIPSPSIDLYRNKMEFAFSRQIDKEKSTETEKVFENRLGQKEGGRWDRVFDITECALMSDKVAPLLAAIRQWAGDKSIPYYDLRKHSGCLRSLLVRHGKNTDEYLVCLFSTEIADEAGYVSAVKSVIPNADIFWGINTSLNDALAKTQIRSLSGKGHIIEKIILPAFGKSAEKTIRFRISPLSFFQTNTNSAGNLYSFVREICARLTGGKKDMTLYDLYGGSAAFSMVCGEFFKKCVCVESVEDSIQDGLANVALNNAANISFEKAKVEDFLPSLEGKLDNSVVILDPPRAGLHPSAVRSILRAMPPDIIYVSCNPENFTRDMNALSKNYEIKEIKGFDLFPRTPHIETAALLSAQ